MREMLWFQLRQFKPPETRDRLADELKRYRRIRQSACRSPERKEQARLYRDRVKEWLRFPENRWCRVCLLFLDRRVPAT